MSVGPPRRRMIHDDAWLFSPFQAVQNAKGGGRPQMPENVPQNTMYGYTEPTRTDDWLTSNVQLQRPKKARRRA